MSLLSIWRHLLQIQGLIDSISTPQCRNIRQPYGPKWNAAPISLEKADFSKMSTRWPSRPRAIAALSPAIPAPTIKMCRGMLEWFGGSGCLDSKKNDQRQIWTWMLVNYSNFQRPRILYIERSRDETSKVHAACYTIRQTEDRTQITSGCHSQTSRVFDPPIKFLRRPEGLPNWAR